MGGGKGARLACVFAPFMWCGLGMAVACVPPAVASAAFNETLLLYSFHDRAYCLPVILICFVDTFAATIGACLGTLWSVMP